MPVFLNGAKSYCDMTEPLLEELDKEIERTKKIIQEIDQDKELMLKRLLKHFDL